MILYNLVKIFFLVTTIAVFKYDNIFDLWQRDRMVRFLIQDATIVAAHSTVLMFHVESSILLEIKDRDLWLCKFVYKYLNKAWLYVIQNSGPHAGRLNRKRARENCLIYSMMVSISLVSSTVQNNKVLYFI